MLYFRGVFVEELVESLVFGKDPWPRNLCFNMYYPDRLYSLAWFGSLTDYTKI